MPKILNLLIIAIKPSSEKFENGVTKSVIKEIPNDQKPPLFFIEVFFWKNEATSTKEFLKKMNKVQPGFIIFKEGFLPKEVETIKHIIDANKKNTLKRSDKLKMFRVSNGAIIETPEIKTISQLSDITKESI